MTALAAAGALALLMSGCTGGDPAPSPSAPTDAAEPIFATDEEALAGFTEAYTSFLAVSGAVSAEGGANPERLETVASGSALEEEKSAALRFAAEGLRTTGEVKFSVSKLQSNDHTANGTVVAAYVCDDISAFELLNAEGESLVVPGRVVDVPYTVLVAGESPSSMKVTERVLWERDNFCTQ